MYPIPANYSSDFLNSLKSDQFIPIYTNASGMVAFTKLMFSGKGYASLNSSGTYAIVFVCDGVESNRFTVQVKSKINSVSFVEQVTTPFFVLPGDTVQLRPVIGLRNIDGNLVEGKIPLSVSIIASNSQYADLVKGYMDTSNEAFQASGKDGLFVLLYRISYLQMAKLVARLKVRFDDIEILSDEFELNVDKSSVDSSICTGITIVSPSDKEMSVVSLKV